MPRVMFFLHRILWLIQIYYSSFINPDLTQRQGNNAGMQYMVCLLFFLTIYTNRPGRYF